MQRFIITSLLFIALFVPAVAPAESLPDLYLESSYRRDAIDYSESERYFYREKLSVLFSEDSALNLAYIYIAQDEEHRHTWSLELKDISPHFSFLMGNFFVNYGYGLLIGRKRLYEPDPFANRVSKGNEKIFKPCKSGNPLYTFSGMTASYNNSFAMINASFNTFYSIKERFIDNEYYDSAMISSGLDSIDIKDDKEYNHNEPVNIHTHGALLGFQIADCFYLQLFYLLTAMQSPHGDEILWDSFEAGDNEYGIGSLYGSGFFAGYCDDFLSIYCEGVTAEREIKNESGEGSDIRGYGLLYGIAFTPPFLNLALNGKEVDGEFYSPYSSSIGEDYPEDAWFFDTEVRPFKNLRAGISLSSQRKTVAGSTDHEIPVTERQKVYINYRYKNLEKLDLAARKLERVSEDGREKKYQFKEKAAVKIINPLQADFSSIYQESSRYKPSYAFFTGVDFSFLTNFKISLNYVYARVAEGNSLYSIVSPIHGSNTMGIFIREDSHIIISKLDFKYKTIYLSCRYLHQFSCGEAAAKRLELFGSGRF